MSEQTKEEINQSPPSITAFDSKKLFLIERDKELKQLMYAMLIGEHLFLQGEAGTGKSMLARHAFALVKNSSMFSIQMSEATLSENLFGAYDISAWKTKGTLLRDITGSILEADFVFIDEIFDAREDILRTLLGVLNERTFSEGRQQETAKLHTCVATANYEQINEKTSPVLDRFLFKAKILPVKKKANRLAMYTQHLKKQDKLKDYAIAPLLDMIQLREFTKRIYRGEATIPTKVLDAYDNMIQEFSKEKSKYISSRTCNKLLDIVRASTLLNNRTEAEYSDLHEIKYGLCLINDAEEERIFDLVYDRCVLSFEKEIEQIKKIDELKDRLKLDAFKGVQLQPNEYVSRMKCLKKAITDLKAMDKEDLTAKAGKARKGLFTQVNKVYEESKDKFFAKQNL